MRIEPPSLLTFGIRPSWINRAGRVDRSACLELRASEVWRQAAHDQWRPVRAKTSGNASVRQQHGRQARAEITITARDLFELHQRRFPQHLVGDRRTPKSNAMRRAHDPPAVQRKRRRRKPHEQPWIAQPGGHKLLYGNPNKGATRTKMLGLWGGGEPGFESGPWTQTLTVERWRFAKHRGHFAAVWKIPPHQRESKLARTQHFIICPACGKKMVKLFMILATEQEIIDAELAEGWIRMLEARQAASRAPMDAELAALRAALIDRYGLLFRGRRLVCRQCLGVRYGEVRKERRVRN